MTDEKGVSMCLGISKVLRYFTFKSMRLDPVVNYIGCKLSLVHDDMIPWFYSPFPIRFDVARASYCRNGTLLYKSRNTNNE